MRLTVQQRINKATIQIKAEIGFEHCVCWLTYIKPAKLMISNIRRDSGVEEMIIEKITKVLFPNIEFQVKEQDLGQTVALVFIPNC